MKAISLTQPWASLVVAGAKQYETRSWSTNYRGPLCIHASLTMPHSAREVCIEEPFLSALREAGYITGDPKKQGTGAVQVPLGCIIGVVELVDVFQTGVSCLPSLDWMADLSEQERAFGDYSPGRYGWKLENPQSFGRHFSVRGSLSIWEVPAQTEALICEELSRLKGGAK